MINGVHEIHAALRPGDACWAVGPGNGSGYSARRPGASLLLVIALAVAGLGLSGCTVFPEKKNPSLQQTTSAEQTERIFREMVRKQDWIKVQPLLAANLVWTMPGRSLTREQVMAYLQGLPPSDYTITDVSVKPNGPDMTVIYTLQTQAGGTAGKVAVVSVWQQVKGGYIMTVHNEQPLP